MGTQLVVQLTDLHAQVGPGDVEASRRIEAAVDLVLGLVPSPAAVLISGDLVNSGTAPEYARLAELLAPLVGLRVLPLVGNHDDRDLLRSTFAGVPEISALADDAPFVQYDAHIAGRRWIALDTQRAGHDDGELCERRLDWLTDQLHARRGAPTTLVMHHPPVRIGIPPLDAVGVPLDQRRALGEVVRAAPQVDRIVCGHVHRSVVATLAGVPVQTAPSVFLPALPRYEHDAPLELVEGPVGLLVHAVLDDGTLASHPRVIGHVPALAP